MSKKLVYWIIVIFFVTVALLIFLQQSNRNDNVPAFLLGSPKFGSISIEKKISGKILPAEEISVKSRVNGIVGEIYVDIGQQVQKGQKIAMVRNMTEPMEAENLNSIVKQARIQYESTLQQYNREKDLLSSGLTSLNDFEIVQARLLREKEQLISSERRLLLSTEGISNNDEGLSNVIVAPAEGVIITLPIKAGSPVINQNIYSEGTTLATIANMNNLNFYGEIAEIDLQYFYEGMTLLVSTQVFNNDSLSATLAKIHPKGRDDQGVVRFSIEARIEIDRKIKWAGINATAAAIVEQKDSVMYVEERFLHYEEGNSYLWIKDENGSFVKTAFKTGISDGL